MTHVLWTLSAIADLANIYEYISNESPSYAMLVVDRITDRTRQIATFPNSGAMVPEYERSDIREVVEYSYRLIYLIEDSSVFVLAVIHGARPLSDSPPVVH